MKRDTQCRNKHLHVQTYSMSKRIFIVILESIIHDIPMFVQHMRYFIVNGDEMGRFGSPINVIVLQFIGFYSAHWNYKSIQKNYALFIENTAVK